MAVKSRLVRQMLEEEYEFEVPTSMIDVVFLLLIFFLVASKFKQPEGRLDAFLPKDAGINPVRMDERPPQELKIYVKQDSSTGYPAFRIERTPVASQPELVQKLKTQAMHSPHLDIVIVGERDVNFMYIIWALDACVQAGIQDVKFQGIDVEGLGRPAG